MNKNGSGSIIRDLTQGSVTQLLLVFAFPLLCSNLLQTFYNMVDMVVIGRFVGKTGVYWRRCSALSHISGHGLFQCGTGHPLSVHRRRAA